MSELRKAAEMALDGFEKIHKGFGAIKEESKFRGDEDIKDLATEVRKNCNKHIKALRQALAQPEQEPVVGMFEEKLPDQNPPPWSRSYRLKRDWVGLTDEEIEKCKIDGGLPHTVNWRLSAKIMQAKLKEKNT